MAGQSIHISKVGARYMFEPFLGGGFKYFLFSSLFGEMIQFDVHIFSDGLKPPTSFTHQANLSFLSV